MEILRDKNQAAVDSSTRNHILNTATMLFAEHGFEGTTIRAISKSAKSNISLISYYFDGKDGLYKEIFHRIQSDRVASTSNILNSSAIESEGDFRLRLSLFIEKMMETTAQNPHAFRIVHREMLEGFPRVKELSRKYFHEMNRIIMSFLTQGKSRGYLKENLSLEVVGMIIMNILIGFPAKASICQEITALNFFNSDHRKIMLENTITVLFDGMLRR